MKIKHYWNKFTKWLQDLLLRLLTAISFLAMLFILLYILYYLFMAYSFTKVIAGCVTLCVMIHLNGCL